MSKKQLEHLRTSAGLLACVTLLCFPAGMPMLSTLSLQKALVSSLLALAIAHSILKLGTLPAAMRLAVFLPMAFSAGMILKVLPHVLVELWLLLPFALLLLSLRPRLPSLNFFWFWLPLWGGLTLGAAGFLKLLTTQINQGLPLLPSHLLLWLCILAVIPLGFASRPMLRPLAKAIARTQIWMALFLLGLYPLIWCTATSFKIPGEPDRAFHDLSPQERFFLLPKEEIPELSPSELREIPLQKELLFALDEMTWRLSDVYIASTFPDDGPLPPKEMVRAMKLYGFLLEDRYGAFLPGASFTQETPEEMEPRYLEDFLSSMRRITLSPKDLSSLLTLPLDTAQQVFNHMQELNWVRQVSGEEDHYRLTSQARKPFENGLYPRQLLLIETAKPKDLVEMVQQDYVPQRKLSSFQILQEFSELEMLGAAETRQVWQWNQHLEFLMHSARWKMSGILILSLILALLAGRCLSDNLSKISFSFLILVGILSCVHFPYVLAFQPAIRIGLGLWIARNLLSLNNSECDRISFFTTCGFISISIMPLASESALVHQCAWILIWTLPALVFLTLAIRPLKRE